MTTKVSNTDDVIDSRDIIARIEELQDLEERDDDEESELSALIRAQEQAEDSPDWYYGETLIRDSYFTDYIKELIHDCYALPKGFDSEAWPWRHLTLDYDAAANEAQADYRDVDFDGVTYWIRA